MRSVMQHDFSLVPSAEIRRSSFDRSHGYKTTFDSGRLVPFFLDEALPGDTFNLSCSLFARLATPIAPFMDNLFLETFFFFVPARLVWDHWQAFNGEQAKPGASTDYLVPLSKVTNLQNGTIGDYFGLPTNVKNPLSVSALPGRSLALIWNEWFRDENLQDPLDLVTDDTGKVLAEGDFYAMPPLPRGKRHDYFTSALPWPQKGDTVDLPLGGKMTLVGPRAVDLIGAGQLVKFTGSRSDFHSDISFNAGSSGGSDTYAYPPTGGRSTDKNTGKNKFALTDVSSGKFVDGSNIDSWYGDLTTSTAISINSMRQAFQVQRLLERDARGGTRYTEIIRSHFGVISPDARLQRPEYLGGSSTRININPVQQTSGTTDVSPQGNLAAYGVAGDSFHGFTHSFTEHGYIIGLVNVRADLTYQQGLNRLWSRETRFDFYWPSLANLGEQAILNKEIYAQGTSEDDDVFGYQERYAEYRYFPSLITGKFRSTDPQSLDIWHLSQKFENLPRLNAEFIQDKPPLKRVIAVPSEPEFLLDVYFKMNCVRPMPVYSVPGMIDHF